MSVSRTRNFVFGPSASGALGTTSRSGGLVSVVSSNYRLRSVSDVVPRGLSNGVSGLVGRALSFVQNTPSFNNTISGRVVLIGWGCVIGVY